ncbi:Fc.00g109920.m01.CDS01 [Cosmosporella sp. VM-42]
MDGRMSEDPFTWHVETVARQLGAANQPWTKDPASLATKVEDEEIDGRTLLTFEHTCSRQELMECLGIKLARHKSALGEVIVDLRSRSREYQKWKQEFLRKQSGFQEDLATPAMNGHATDDIPKPALGTSTQAMAHHVSEPEPHINDDLPAINGIQNGAVPEAELPIKMLGLDPSTSDEAQTDPSANRTLTANHSLPRSTEVGVSVQQHSDQERPLKRRRVAPVLVTTTPPTRSKAFIPTEADVITFPMDPVQDDLPWEKAPGGTYLGDGSLQAAFIRSTTGPLSSRIVKTGEHAFATLVPNRLPPGRRLTVHKVIKRLLIWNGKQERLQRYGMARMPSLTPPDDDSIDLRDLPDILDPITLKEMEEERQETERRKSRTGKDLSPERVKAILDEAISSMTLKWEPKLKHKLNARRRWNDARRRGTKKLQILKAHEEAQFFDRRIKKLCTEILDNKWQREVEVQNQAKCLEQTVNDKLHQVWLANMLESRTEPPKPQTIPRPKRSVVQQSEDLVEDEVLTSSDEDDFVVPEYEPGFLNGDHMNIDSPLLGPYETLGKSIKEELSDAIYMDLTQIETPEKGTTSKKKIFIDLTSPVKPQDAPQPSHPLEKVDETAAEVPSEVMAQSTAPALESLGPIEDIGARSPKRLAKENDRWRLVICMIWKLPHARRRALFDFLHYNRLDDAWEAVHSQMSDPVTDSELPGLLVSKLVAFDLTRVFLSFSKCRFYKERHFATLKQKTKDDLEKARHTWFAPFCVFVEGLAPQFPQDSQIYRVDVLDDPMGDDLEDGLDDDRLVESSASIKRKGAPKEIIQNKAAVDLRERERQRQQEQDSRRRQLRAQMVNSMPQNKARLIINETKQDDHSFIYFNEDIGKRIMDHQISGVRFMWNEIVLDARTRQGCLLAHTMGLGKTMQVITLLVAIAEAAASPDPSVSVQIPEDLRRSQTLILCPPALVDNWMDELLTWAPAGLLGPLRKIAASTPQEERLSVVQSWATGSGILVIGHNMFKGLVSNLKEAEELLLNKTNLVVVDEAHKMKDPNTGLHQAASRFATKTRIALTGSPLANNVEEYYQMIHWVAPNFLGPLQEFRGIYANPIQRGLWGDSTGSQKRQALKKLEALKETVAAKINRATMKMIAKDLPPKHEFVISLSPTPIQSKLYALYIQGLIEKPGSDIQQGQLFAITNQLALICNHPSAFREKLKEIEDDIKKPGGAKSWFPIAILQPVLRELNLRDPLAVTLSRKAEFLVMILDEARLVGDKVLVFSQNRTTLSFLESLCKVQCRSYSTLHGGTSIASRQDSVKSFNTDGQEVYLISTKAGGVGLNIQGANRVVIFDFQWNPVDVQQAVGRAYRIGQTKETFVYQFVVAGTFEENLHNKHVFKMQLSSRVVDKTNPLSWGKRKGDIIHHIETKPAIDLEPFLGKDQILDKLIRYKKDGEAIRSIVSTDTFEEEDLDAKLTIDERREVDEEVRQNRLRATDPQEYLRQKKQREFELRQRQAAMLGEARRQLQASYVTAPTLPQPAPRQIGDGQPSSANPLDTNSNQSNQPQPQPQPLTIPDGPPAATGESSQLPDPSFPPPSSAPAPAPLPLVGANTYFGEQRPGTPPASMPAETPKLAPRTAGQSTPVKRGGLFDSSKSAARTDFENKLGTRIEILQRNGVPGIAGDAKEIAKNFTEAVHEVRKENSFGFLPDNQHWRLLDESLQHDRFVIAMISGYLTPRCVALANRDYLQSRISIIDGMSEKDFAAQAGRGIGALEPSV